MSPSKDADSSGENTPERNTPRQSYQAYAQRGIRQSISNFAASPGVKFFLTGFITLALMIPTLIVWGLVEERANRADEVAQSIAQGWGGQQTINGPYLVVPYTINEKVDRQFKQVTRHAIISANWIAVDGDIAVEERKKSIYKTQLYHFKSNLTGAFDSVDLEKIKEIGGIPKPSQAYLAIGISDMTGIRAANQMELKGFGKRKLLPGLRQIKNPQVRHLLGARHGYSPSRRLSSGGVHVPLQGEELDKGFEFELSLSLNGSKEISFVPAGSSTELKLKSNWPHPGFDGEFLPEERVVNEEGFNATWTVPSLARGIDIVSFGDNLPGLNSAIEVTFVEPLDFYQVTSRTLKYAIGFFSLVFLTVFVLELSGRQAIHWVQYTLVGLAMVVFYVLLLAFAEQVGFDIAYAVSSIATTGLISWYVGGSLGQKHGTAIMAAILGLTYAIMYMILNQEEIALLAGSIVAFGAIAATMAVTRKVDWSNNQEQPA